MKIWMLTDPKGRPGEPGYATREAALNAADVFNERLRSRVDSVHGDYWRVHPLKVAD